MSECQFEGIKINSLAGNVAVVERESWVSLQNLQKTFKEAIVLKRF